MPNPPPAAVGMSIDQVDTPALLIELDAFERNMKGMQDRMDRAKMRFRPHAKTHKCAAIAHQQIALGAVGICCQKVSEAEALAWAGVRDIMITNQLIGPLKVERAAALARYIELSVCVDDAQNVRQLASAAKKFDVQLNVMLEINVGADRCGVAPGAGVVDLVRLIDQQESLNFIGLQAYQGSAQHLRSFSDRKDAVARAAELTGNTVEVLKNHGYACRVIAGGGTGTHPFEAGSGVYNEIQSGSYVFMDADYGKNRNRAGEYERAFENSLFILASVMSHASPGRAVVDAGLKSMSFESGLPVVVAPAGVSYIASSDEHGILEISRDTEVRLGDKLRLIPGHCDPTVNLHDWFVCVRGTQVEAVWPVTARGAVY